MTWTSPKTWQNEPLIAGDLNTHLRDNLEALKEPPQGIYSADLGAEYTTSNTSFTNVDTTDTEGFLRHTLDCKGGNILCNFVGACSIVGTMYFNVSMDGTDVAIEDGFTFFQANGTTIKAPMSFTYIIPKATATAGSHIFRLRFKVSAGATNVNLYAGATANLQIHPQFFVCELT